MLLQYASATFAGDSAPIGALFVAIYVVLGLLKVVECLLVDGGGGTYTTFQAGRLDDSHTVTGCLTALIEGISVDLVWWFVTACRQCEYEAKKEHGAPTGQAAAAVNYVSPTDFDDRRWSAKAG